jgi:hypothetical protein
MLIHEEFLRAAERFEWFFRPEDGKTYPACKEDRLKAGEYL